MNKLLPVAMTIFLLSCEKKQKEHHYEVQYHGALKTLMMEGDLTATTSMVEYEQIEDIYALGARENLKGEIQVFNGRALNSHVKNDSLHIDTTYTGNAALLIFAQVPSWTQIKIP